MATNPNKLSQFWQELMRRNVVRVVTVYAGAAFVTLELVDIVAEPLKLPSWLLPAVIVLLSIGFIIAIILSWIYDIHPKGGMVKTEPAENIKPDDFPKSSNGWMIASYISFVVIVGLIVLNIISRSDQHRKNLEKSVAVLPLAYLSEDPNKEYLADGVLDAITGHLSLIEGLRVMPRTSVEQYRENKKPAKQIGEELGVSYLIEGSFQLVGNQVKLIIQLVDAVEGDHVFFSEYDREYKDIFAVQSEVAKTIAREIEVVITPEEKQLIEKVMTLNLSAYDLFQRGRDEHWKYWMDNDNWKALERAETLYHEAIKYDSKFAQAYTGLAWAYWDKNYWPNFFLENFVDSILPLTNNALSYDDQLSEAYTIRGIYFNETGNREQAIEELNKATEYNPNDWQAYWEKAKLHEFTDAVKSIENSQKAAELNRGSQLPNILRWIGTSYANAGFPEKAKDYAMEAFKLDGDSTAYYHFLGFTEGKFGNFKISFEHLHKAYAIDSNDVSTLATLGFYYNFTGQHKESLKYYKKYLERLKVLGRRDINSLQRIAYEYLQNGYPEEAEKYFDKQMEVCNQMIRLKREWARLKYTYYDLASLHALRGEKYKAYENLKIFNQKKVFNIGMVTLINDDPLFDSIRDEPEFQQIVRDVEFKYQAEHERVREWLVENEML